MSALKEDDLVVEIGAGKGRLTEFIAEKVSKVLAIEVDRRLCRELMEKFSGREEVEIVCGDVLKFDFTALPPFKVIANIPYYITTPILFRLLEDSVPLITATLTVQKEVAERIVASAGTKKYGVLSVMVQFVADVEVLFYIPKGAFAPPPKVDSAVVFIKRLSVPRVSVSDRRLFRKIVKTAFRQRRKTIANSLKPIRSDIKDLLLEVGVSPDRRAETLTLEDFALITEAVKSGSQ
jgi:16S rRNA (adenine1518-N6/adenine1519-N6)-dimethyltransferase